MVEDPLEAEQEPNIGINPSVTVQSGIASYYTAAQAILVQETPHLWIYSIGLWVQSRNLLSLNGIWELLC